MKISHYDQFKKTIEEVGNSMVRFRLNTYSGRGRPKKSDVIMIPANQYFDYLILNAYSCAW